MLNAKGERELAYVVNVDAIEPIVGSDNCEAAVIGGWRVMVKKGEFKPGDKAVYFEIDSKVDPENPAFEFLAKKHFAIKTQKYTFGGKGNFISQGLIMRLEDLGIEGEVGEFLTEQLKITYYVAEDNKRKAANPEDKYKKMAQRHPAIFRKGFVRWLMKRNWGKKLLYVFFGRIRHSDLDEFPKFVSKTDEERIQNMPYILNDKEPWIVTEKIDGTSTTAALEVGKFGKHKFWICSRNVAFGKKKKDCFYEENYYTKMSEKYKFEEVLEKLAKTFNAKTVALQGETFGASVQKRDYGIKYQDFRGFNLYIDGKRLNSVVARDIMAEYGIQWVPILDTNFTLPDTVDEMLAYAAGTESQIDGGMREGVVLRSQDGTKSFKAVSNEFLLKYHG
jgi:hypothetical protein